MTKKVIQPDFLITPYQLVADSRVEPLDEKVYAIVYWFEHMKDGECRASNGLIASIARKEPRSVQNSLNKLEELGYIERQYKDEARRNRKRIITKIAFKNVRTGGDTLESSEPMVIDERTDGDRHERSGGDQSSNSIRSNRKKKAPPSAQEFLNDRQMQTEMAASISESKGIAMDLCLSEIEKFVSYWTEPNKSGTKLRWEAQRFFDVRRRLSTWFKNVSEFNRSTQSTGKISSAI